MKAMPVAATNQLRATKGVVLKIRYRRPSVSMKKMEAMVPTALMNDSGMLRTSALDLLSRLGI